MADNVTIKKENLICPKCKAVNEPSNAFCEKCGGSLKNWNSDPSYAVNKNPVISMLLSFFIPGVGQIYNGDTTKGIVLVVCALFLGTATFGIIWIACIIYAMIDASAQTGSIFNRKSSEILSMSLAVNLGYLTTYFGCISISPLSSSAFSGVR